MKFTVSQKELRNALAIANAAIPSRPTHPILGCFLVDVSADEIKFTGFDLKQGIEVTIEGRGAENGLIAIPAKLFFDIITRLPEGDVTFLASEEEGAFPIKISSTSGEFQLQGLFAGDYPSLPKIESDRFIEFPSENLSQAIKSVLFAASKEETKQVLTGIHFTFSQDKLELAATDGHRLSVIKKETEGNDEHELTIPANALGSVVNAIKGNETVRLAYDDAQAVIETGDLRITTRLLEGAYPAYPQLIPQSFKETVAINRKQLIDVLNLVGVLADEKYHLIQFQLKDNNLSVVVDGREKGSATQELPVQYNGDEIAIGFNLKYLTDGLRAMDSTEVLMKFNGELTPVVFTPLNDVNMTFLVMPVNVRK